MMGLRAAPKEDCGLSSAELVYGEPLTLPGEFLEGVERPPPDFTHQLRQHECFPASSYETATSTAGLGCPLFPDEGSVRVHQERTGSLLSLTPLHWALQSSGERPEVFPVGCRRPQRGRVGGPTQASPGCLTTATSTATQERPASSCEFLSSGGSWRPRTTSRVAEAVGPAARGGSVEVTENPPRV